MCTERSFRCCAIPSCTLVRCDISMTRITRLHTPWRICFDDLPDSVAHYTLTQVDSAYQDDLRGHARLAAVTPTSILALNISLTALAANLVRGANAYVADMLVDRRSAPSRRLSIRRFRCSRSR